MKLLKGFVLGVVFAVVLGMAFTSFADVVLQSIEVAFDSINVKVNGVAVTKPNILYNGTTYVPLRAIGEILGKDVIWDGDTRTANINDKDYVSPDSTPGYSRNNPAAINTKIRCDFTNGYYEGTLTPKKYVANITVNELFRGDEAWNIIKQDSYLAKYQQPKEGKDYIVTKITFDLTDAPDRYSLGYNFFTLVSEAGKDYDGVLFSIKPSINADLYKGASSTGYAVFEVDRTDIKPLIAFERNYDGTGGVWFKAYK